jgi:hypothetical protein
MHRYLGGLMDPFVTLLEVHKFMYMQEAGEPLRLQFAKALYGPYAENLRHVLRTVEGHLVSGYADGGDAPDKQVESFETPFGLELLATVHWVATRENAASAEDAAVKVYAWNDRKERFSPRQIGIAFETLRANGWLSAA